MSKTKKILMFTSAILMIVSGIVTSVLCIIALVQPTKLNDIIFKLAKSDGSNLKLVKSLVQFFVSYMTAGSVVGIVFGGISIKFCLYDSIEFFQRQSVVLTVAIVCAVCVNILVGALYIVATLVPDKNLNLEEIEFDQKTFAMEKLEKLAEMKQQGLVNEDEYEVLKAEIMNESLLDEEK